MISTMPRARKIHRCENCLDDIAAGERYVKEVWPPWTPVQEDPEDGPSRLGEWVTRRFHATCYP